MRIKITNALLATAVLLVLAALPGQFTYAQTQRPGAPVKRAAVYSCPMHAEVKAKRPGKCPKCGMALRLVKDEATRDVLANTTAAPLPAPPAGPAETVAAHALRIPDTTVYDQNGRKLNFYTDLVKGKTVAINFIFTTCTTICPPLTATFRKVQQELSARVGRDVSLISVSVDPTTDVPARLRDFSAKFNAAPGWTFVTGSKPEIDQLLNALGAAVADKNDHTPMILIGNDAANYWTRAYGLAPAATLVKAINEAAGQQPVAQAATETKKTDAPARPGASYFTNLTLLTQDNRPVHFYDDLMKDKVVLINFVFTTCKGACSPMTANLAKVQQYLGAHLGKEIVMLSVSVDPTTDTPAALKKYADLFKAQPGWYFLTGKKENVDWVLYKLGGYVEDKNQHGLALIIGNEATGDWVKMHAMAKPSDIADAALKLLAAK